MPDTTNPIGFTDTSELRGKNRATVERYINARGQDRLRRHEPFVEGGCGGLWTTDIGSPIVIRGKDRLVEHAIWSLKCFPSWEWYSISMFGTGDPNHLQVGCGGYGKILFPGYPEDYYKNHFPRSFELEGGKIKRNREFMNIFQQLRALSIPVPEVKRGGTLAWSKQYPLPKGDPPWTIYYNTYDAAKRCSNPNGTVHRVYAVYKRTCAAVRC